MISRALHSVMDGVLCSMMNFSQWKLRRHVVTRERLEAYLAFCNNLDYRSYYATPEEKRSFPISSYTPEWRRDGSKLSWKSPLQGPFPENNTARTILHDTMQPREAPTLILLHALMSANDFGYRRIASRFNERGWNVLFPHLPFHYSRIPKGYANGALTITSDLVRNAETLRQSVIELRQLIDWARSRGSKRIALMGTSYGGWVAAVTLALEELDFAILLQPVADVEHATFGSPASSMMSELLKKNHVSREVIRRHAHLSSPLKLKPSTRPERITVIGGKYDRLSPSESLRSLCISWGGANFREVPQGHFGYRAMECAMQEAELFLDKPAPLIPKIPSPK